MCVWQNQSLYVMRLQKANRKQGVKAAGRQMHLTEGKEILAINLLLKQSRWPPESESWLVRTGESKGRPPARDVTEGGK